jgi:hypothetical protein
MKDHENHSGDTRIRALLREVRVLPALPPRFEQNVWRRIKDAEVPVKAETWLDALVALLLRPRFALAAAVMLLLGGVLAGTLDGRQLARHDAELSYVASVAPHVLR